MFKKETIKGVDVKNKKVLLRAPLNVPIIDGKVTDTMRLNSVLPTLQYLLEQDAKVIILSHHSTEGESLKPIAASLSELLGKPVEFMSDCISEETKQKVAQMQPGEVVVLENLRFHKEEEDNDESFAKQLASLGEIYVDDDFTVMHREHASVVGIPKFLPAVAGLQVEKEVIAITNAIENPKRPLLAIIGGAKISTKIEILSNLLNKVDAIFVGGAMANTFLVAAGKPVGKSIYEKDQLPLAEKIVNETKAKNIELFQPTDVIVTKDIKTAEDVRTIDVEDTEQDDIIADIGPRSIDQLAHVLHKKGTVIWNGTIGVAEYPAFANGSHMLAQAIISSGSDSLVGGGDTAAFVNGAGLSNKFGFVSTGGGASLELMSSKELPGIKALLDKK